ncbi:MAG: cytochrome c [Phycisphaerales bacterium]|nr:cytochrome c [Phycisphaerales bacterium]
MKLLLPTPLIALLFLGCGDATQPPPKPIKKQTGEQIFVMYCAMCHGILGDGKGTVTLDRPARSFIDGGFSFGNTVNAILKTTRSGIPGTPMPPFEDILDEEQTTKVATYVRSLAPTLKDVVIEETELVVNNRPLVVRGMIPPIQGGLQLHPRGLVIGNPDGFSYEYRVDDVRLLAIRQGRFVERADWGARGGSPLSMLGKIIVLIDNGNPSSIFATSDMKPLQTKLVATNTLGDYATITYDIVDNGGNSLATVQEQCVPTTGARALIEQQLTITASTPLTMTILKGTSMDDSAEIPIGTSVRTIIHAARGSEE